MIKTRFELNRYSPEPVEPFTIEMPYPVRIGDEIESDESGRNWMVKSVAWIISEENGSIVELIVKLA